MTAISPISHYSDEQAGNTSMFRRLSIISNGERASVPVVSGNSVRGQLRRIAARQLVEGIGVSKLGTVAYHTIFSGGALTRGAEDHAHRIDAIKTLRSAVPMIGLFGAALTAEIIPGSLRVDIVWPICRETVQITGIESDRAAEELVDTIYYTRHDGHEVAVEVDKTATDTNQMIFEGETIVAGTQLIGGVRLYRATPLEAACLDAALTEWMADPRLGGMPARGHGKVRAEIDTRLGDGDLYRANLAESADAIKAALEGLQ